MKKIIVLGSSGMLGHMVYFYLRDLGKYEVIDVSYQSKLTDKSILLDAYNKQEVEELILRERPDFVINCVGILIGGANSNPSNAIYLNAYFPNQLSSILEKTGGKLIHISTDCVFSGKRGSYQEDDLRDADDTYGKSKALGEVINSRDLTLRTSIIGPELKAHGVGLFHWFMQQMGEINGYTHAIWSGVTTLEMAKVIHEVIEQDIVGLAHVTNGEKIPKFELLELLKEIWKRNDVSIKAYGNYFVDKSLMPSKRLIYQVPSYRKMLEEQYNWMKANQSLYGNFYHM
ncbi:dTDP-4-dehydrorhamnose reductase family protein [Aquirufa ecclesiirivi]|uniref:dTDP-4-dehydrorhamnose reductase family protein n=1 Tax=Aquirufa ecclesiirivi TaxID=2715124 RepID=UPI0022A88F78|nr:SDR family oxidoreductase [Aquirufa ecclesiirivi]